VCLEEQPADAATKEERVADCDLERRRRIEAAET
jgi:hypothetical protein